MLIYISTFLLLISSMVYSAERLTREVHLMGTSFQITLHEPDRQKAIKETEAMIRIVEETENQISNWRANTELSKLNQQVPGQPFQMTESFCDLIKQLKEWSVRTDGAFDPGIGELLRTWGTHSEPRVASNTEIFEALQSAGIQHVEIRKDCQAMKQKSILLDAGAFGKGYAIDRLLRYASEHKLEPLLIDFGGQIAVYSAANNKKWEIPISDPAARQKLSSISIPISSGSLSTSGGSEKDRIVNGKRIGHILDPRIGRPAAYSGSVTVWHQNALAADILSTALYVMGKEKGLEWANENQVAVLFLDDQDTGKSKEFNKLIFRN